MRIKDRLVALAYALLLVCGPSIVLADPYQYYPNSPIHLGATFDPRQITEVHLPCIKFDGRSQLDAYNSSSQLGMETQYTVDQLKTRHQLYNYLHISASVSGHYKFFSGGASYDLEQESTFDSDSFSWVIRGYTKYGEFGMSNPRLNAEAEALKSDATAFRSRCGTDFVGQESRSVLIAAVYTVKNLSETNWKKVSADFNAAVGGGVWGLDAKAKYDSFFKEAVTNGTLSFRLYIIGGEGIKTLGDLALATGDIEKVKQIIADYTKQLSIEYSVPTDFLTGSLRQFVPSLGAYDFGLYNKFIEDAYLELTEDQARADRLRMVLLRSDDYGLTEDRITSLKANLDGLTGAISKLYARAQSCRELHDVTMSALRTPSQQAKIKSTCALNSDVLYTARIAWPLPQPYVLSYWTDDLSHSPQVFMYVEVTGPHVAEARLESNTGQVKSVLPLSAIGQNHRAFGAFEYSLLTDSEKPLQLVVITDSGNVYKKELAYSPSAPVSAAVLPPPSSVAAAAASSSVVRIMPLTSLKTVGTAASVAELGARLPSANAKASSISEVLGGSRLAAPQTTAGATDVLIVSREFVHCTGDDTYCVRRQSSSKTCVIQKTTASPIGADFKGPFPSRADANAAMCRSFDPSMQDETKCWATVPDDACK